MCIQMAELVFNQLVNNTAAYLHTLHTQRN